MGLLNREERSALIDLLLKLPGKEKPSVRTNLLAFVSPTIKNNIDRDGAPRQDFSNILGGVDDEEWDQPPVKGEWPIVTLLANAVDHAGAGSRLGTQLKTVQATVTERAAVWAGLPRTTPPQSPRSWNDRSRRVAVFWTPPACDSANGPCAASNLKARARTHGGPASYSARMSLSPIVTSCRM
jgi:hypothetical protein